MEVQQALTLSQKLPDVFLATLKRMPGMERHQLLNAFKKEYPKEYAAWLTADVKAYIKFINTL